MAQRRMFSLQIVDTDAFLEMPPTSQNLYFHLGMRGDDDGFVPNPKKIMKACTATEDDLKILLSKRFIIGFETGIIVIKHWKINNYIQRDRYKETNYIDEKAKLLIKENGSYTECIQLLSNLDTQVRLGKDSIGKDSIGKERGFTPPTSADVQEYLAELNEKRINPQSFCDYYESKGWMIGKNKMKSWKAAVRTWIQRENDRPPHPQKLDTPEARVARVEEIKRIIGE